MGTRSASLEPGCAPPSAARSGALPFMDLWNADSRRMVGEMRPWSRGNRSASSPAHAAPARDPKLEFELLALPLRYHAAADARIILGALAEAEVPYWFGVEQDRTPLAWLDPLPAPRHQAPRPGPRRRPPPSPAGRIRHGWWCTTAAKLDPMFQGAPSPKVRLCVPRSDCELRVEKVRADHRVAGVLLPSSLEYVPRGCNYTCPKHIVNAACLGSGES